MYPKFSKDRSPIKCVDINDPIWRQIQMHSMLGRLSSIERIRHDKGEIVPFRALLAQSLLELLDENKASALRIDFCEDECCFFPHPNAEDVNKSIITNYQLADFISSGKVFDMLKAVNKSGIQSNRDLISINQVESIGTQIISSAAINAQEAA